MSAKRKFKRVILKLSGEALAGEKGYGIDPVTVDSIAGQIQAVRESGLDVAIGNGKLLNPTFAAVLYGTLKRAVS